MNKFQLSVLKYRHSFLLDEKVNVGLLLFFDQDQSLEFLYPNSLQRITSLYPDFSYRTLRKYFKSFDKQAKSISKKLKSRNKFANELNVDKTFFTSLVNNKFLIKDSTTLYFTEPESGIYESKQKVIDYYRKEFISLYDKNSTENRRDENYLIKKFENRLNQKEKKLKENFKTNITVETEYFTENFEYGWLNGRLNLITPIGFDLTDEEYIKNKGYKWKGKLSSLQEVAQKKNLKFDLLLSRPSSKKLFKVYDKVVSLVLSNETPKEIIEEDEIDSYLDQAINYLRENTFRSHLDKYHILKTKSGWKIKKEGDKRATSLTNTKEEAIKKARNIAKNKGNVTIIVHRKDGKVQEEYNYPKSSNIHLDE